MNTQQSEVIYIHDLALILGTTEGSIRGHIARENDDAIPPGFKLGKKHAWKRSTVDAWLNKKNSKGNKS